MCKRVLVVLNQNFGKNNKKIDYLSTASNSIQKSTKEKTDICFFNKKTDNPKDFKDRVSRKPDVILFDGCEKTTIKKMIGTLCPETKSKTCFCSIRSEHELPNVTKVKTFSEVGVLIS